MIFSGVENEHPQEERSQLQKREGSPRGLPLEDQLGQDVEPMSPPSLQSSVAETVRKRGSGIG
jgi:hypothetical protein